MAKESKIITNLKSVRESIGMTQQELADRIGIRRETILHLENNRYNPSLEMALKIAQVFNLQVEELFQLKEKGEKS
ncbi:MULTISPECIES: helix-turn-helix transcriptional regulator [Streptococcus]|uniref:helix-turn-helix transcriptional regulator n=1 Tax=Streptococcus TaxID=1301 RepID=UPI0007819107|nr:MULTISPECIES: helix-turn-helix transcriptional regulator [Streptococcus]KXT63498.1 Transcriptional regulator, Cro/CI family [Streptococcus sp. DD04]MCF1283409.1 helix-turn-helix transcriptional regulator [Streptococcus sinensis]